MLPEGFRWHDADGRDTPGWWQLLGPSGAVVAKIQPVGRRYYIKVGLDGYAHAVKSGSTASLERAKMHVERWAGERGLRGVIQNRPFSACFHRNVPVNKAKQV